MRGGGRSECGVNKCGEALRSASASASSHTNLEPLVFFYFLFFLLLFFFFIIFILLYFNIYLLNEEEEH